jgi:glycosyltransferase involved in cell wall biosynthesis
MSKIIGGGHQQMNGGVSIAYSGVHQAYQLALAAFELGELTRFYCSIYSRSGKWGGVLARLIGSEQLRNRRIDGLCSDKIFEHPWPLLTQRLRACLARDRRDDWLFANDWFDRWVAHQLPLSGARLFIGVETCAAASFAAARECGTLRILDSPGVPARFLDNMALEAAERFGLPPPRKWDVPAMAERKAKEMELADAIFVCSKLQARLLGAAGKKTRLLPLWVDSTFWHGAGEERIAQAAPLKVLFVGKIGLRKGVPYLLEALSSASTPVALTMIGAVDDALRPLLNRCGRQITLKPPCGKMALREQYRAHDLLILPSLGDSFGSVALEAMAC